MTLLPNDLVFSALKKDSYLFDSILMLLLSISLICCSVYSFPKYCFELPVYRPVATMRQMRQLPHLKFPKKICLR